jgi:hypothetical protein
MAATSSSFVRSATTVSTSPEASRSAALSTVSSSPSSSTSVAATVRPLHASATAVARPIPDAAPVTMATFSVVKWSSSSCMTWSRLSSAGVMPSDILGRPAPET